MKKVLMIVGLVVAVSWLWPVTGYAYDTVIRHMGGETEHHWGGRGHGRRNRGGQRDGGWRGHRGGYGWRSERGGNYGYGCYYR